MRWWSSAVGLAAWTCVCNAALAVPARVPYVGEVRTTGGSLFEGTLAVEARLFGEPAGGGVLWSESLGAVAVEGGVLQLVLGQQNPAGLGNVLESNDALYLELSLDGAAMLPRQVVLSVPFARVSGNAQHLEGLAAEDFVVLDSNGNAAVDGALIAGGGVVVGSDKVIDGTGQWVGDPSGLTGPQGLPGPPGPTGAKGPTGAVGPTGASGTSSWIDGPGRVTTEAMVGIGMAVPQRALDVSGTVRASGAVEAQAVVASGTIDAAQVAAPIVTTSSPVAGNQAATKDYVDAIVASAAEGGAAEGLTCYYTKASGCGAGFEAQPGTYESGSGANHTICCARAVGSSATTGFFVLTESGWAGGSLAGLAGANAKCLAELQAKSWLGKGLVPLTEANVKAFLCDDTTCQDPLPGTAYRFARAGAMTMGGAQFVTDFYGRGPQDEST